MKGLPNDKDMADLTPKIQREIRDLTNMPESDINTDDIPESTNWADAKRGLFYRPVKQQITLRLDVDLVHWFNAHARKGRGFQTKFNSALREYLHRYENMTTSGRSE